MAQNRRRLSLKLLSRLHVLLLALCALKLQRDLLRGLRLAVHPVGNRQLNAFKYANRAARNIAAKFTRDIVSNGTFFRKIGLV